MAVSHNTTGSFAKRAVLIAALFALLPCNAAANSVISEALDGYREVARLSYHNAHLSAKLLRQSVDALLANPSEIRLADARQAWRNARKDYSQTEAFRFGNWFVDEWETQINSWPIDEGYIDYVDDSSYIASATNPLARHNVVANPKVTIGGTELDSANLVWSKVIFLHEASDHETNVMSGYHAVEFLLWGQDLNRHGGGAGERPATDYSKQPNACSSGNQQAPIENCQRRRKILQILTEHLEFELRIMSARWTADNGSYGDRLVTGNPKEGLRRALFGITALSGDELAGERMLVPLYANSPEEEQDCFSDDTHNSLFYNHQGVVNIYTGSVGKYKAEQSLASLALRHAPKLSAEISNALAVTTNALDKIRQHAETGKPFDQLLAPSNNYGFELISKAISSLQNQASLFEQLGDVLELGVLNPQAPRD